MVLRTRSRKVSKSSIKIGKRVQRALLRKAGLLPAWVEPPPRPPPRELIPLDQLPQGALAPHLQPILDIARRHLNAEQLVDAFRPRYWGDRRYRPEEEPAPQPVPPPAQDLLPNVIEEPEAEQEPIQAPPPDIEQPQRQVRYRQQFVGRGLLRRVVHQQERQEEAAAAAAPKAESESESEDGIQLCHESSSEESTAESSATGENRRHFERELATNPALRRAYERSEAARRERGRFNAHTSKGFQTNQQLLKNYTTRKNGSDTEKFKGKH
ncbi:hypothetical protein DAPPUDRAFT_243984 [Daphnia pulex]|uniref:Uncharacterized protein n=1 Tax=Daphnia pulex TaxID=6669 RepID=E9GJY4_DAPPU|nr:hypothetical protein DAPPUDRAFT_243984 [Daphnia pulex]|eukprot:EFX80197.1 hypothetical protein DAPPUDRAFT_243984 [Daphnia pulex]